MLLSICDTTVMLKPREKWRPGMTYEKLIREMDEKLQFPGLTNTWTMPVQNRLDMALTGIKTPVGMKLQGTNLEQIQQLGAQVQKILSGLPQVRSVSECGSNYKESKSSEADDVSIGSSQDRSGSACAVGEGEAGGLIGRYIRIVADPRASGPMKISGHG
jgi:hypothetical protein